MKDCENIIFDGYPLWVEGNYEEERKSGDRNIPPDPEDFTADVIEYENVDIFQMLADYCPDIIREIEIAFLENKHL